MRVFKWMAILIGGAAGMVLIAVLLAFLFIDVEKYRPEIEKQATAAIGAPVSLGKLSLSLFPSAGINVSDVRIGNPSGFKEKELLFVRTFQVEVKVMPLLSRELRIERFVLDGPRLILEKSEAGKANWEALGGGKSAPAAPATEPTSLPIRKLDADTLSIRNGSVFYVDRAANVKRELTGLGLTLKDLSFDRPISIDFSGVTEEGAVSLKGRIGPLGPSPGKDVIAFDLTGNAFRSLEANFKGKIETAASAPRIEADFGVSPFSPRALLETIKVKTPHMPADPSTLARFSISGVISADADKIELTKGKMELDASKAVFSGRVSNFVKPVVTFDFSLDQIDLDRYLSPDPKAAPSPEAPKQVSKAETKPDYSSLRSLALDAGIRIAKIKAKGAKLEDLNLKLSGKGGVFRLNPVAVKLYKGSVQGEAGIDFRTDLPKSSVKLKVIDVEANPLMRDVMEIDILEGAGSAEFTIHTTGDTAAAARETLNGEGNLQFSNGAIKGFDLAGMVRNVEVALGLGEKGADRPRTDFSDLKIPFKLINGVADISGSTLASPFLRLAVNGKADLSKEILDMRMEPKLVATIKGQGDESERRGITVPVLITGTFEDPKFRPDLKAVLQQKIEERLPSSIKEGRKLLESPVDGASPAEKGLKLLEKLPFGR